MNPFLLVVVPLALLAGLVLFLDRQFPGALSSDDSRIDLIWSGVVLVTLVGSLAVALRRERIGAVARSAVVWIVLGFALVAGYSFRDELAPLWQRVAGNLMPGSPVTLGPGIASLRAGSQGHFTTIADVSAGGRDSQRIRFMVDTGASDVALTRDDARRLGIDVDSLRFTIPYSTANGTSFGARVRLDHVKIGDIVLQDVAGSVVQGNLEQSLLGMSFLRRLSGFEIRGSEMILRK